MTRAEAIRSGKNRYFTGKPCKHGHVCERHTHNRVCVDCNNKSSRAWAKRCNSRVAANVSKWRAKNPERSRATQIKSNKVWYSKPENRLTACRGATRWAAENPEKARSYKRNRRAWKRGNGGSHTAEDILDILKNQRGKCIYCPTRLRDKYHVDHVVPLSKGGRNDRQNLQLLCEPCNLSKGSKDPIEFSQQRGLLL